MSGYIVRTVSIDMETVEANITALLVTEAGACVATIDITGKATVEIT